MEDYKKLEDEIMHESICYFLCNTDNVKLEVLKKRKEDLCKVDELILDKINNYKYTITKDCLSNNKGKEVFIENKETSIVLRARIDDNWVSIRQTDGITSALNNENFLDRFYIIGIVDSE